MSRGTMSRLTCPECDGGLDGTDLAYGLVCPHCGIRVAGPFTDDHDVPAYISIYEKPKVLMSRKKSPKQLDAEIAATLAGSSKNATPQGRLSKTLRLKLRGKLRRVVKEAQQFAGGRLLRHDDYQQAGEDAIKLCGLYGRVAAQAGDQGVEIWEIVDGRPDVDSGAIVQWSDGTNES